MRVFCTAVLLMAVCGNSESQPLLDAERWKNFGVAHLEQEEPNDAVDAFRKVIALAPTEVLGYANLGLSHLRMAQLDSARLWLARALEMAPANADVHLLMAEWFQFKGDLEGAVASSQRAVELQPSDAIARYFLYKAASARPQHAQSAVLAAEALDRLYADIPENLVIALQYAQALAQEGDLDALEQPLEALKPIVSDVEQAPRFVDAAIAAREAGNAAKTEQSLQILGNVLRTPSTPYKQALTEIQSPVIGLPILRFSDAFYESLGQVVKQKIPVRFSARGVRGLPSVEQETGWRQLEVADVDADGWDDILVLGELGASLWLRLEEGWQHVELGNGSSAIDGHLVDLDNNGVLDVVLAGSNGLRLFLGDSTRTWTDVTVSAGITDEPTYSVTPIDSDNEGDLDLVVGVEGGLRFWQNGLDGTFADVTARTGLPTNETAIVELQAADFDDDLDTDLLATDSNGNLHLFDNLRLGRFGEKPTGLSAGYLAAKPSDIDGDGRLDLIGITRAGALVIHRGREGGFATGISPVDLGFEATGVTSFDADNDGRSDLLVYGETSAALLRTLPDGTLGHIQIEESAGLLDAKATEQDGDGDLDLVALGADGRLRSWSNDGGNANHWLRVRLQGLRTSGTKNNLYGIGSKLEVKAGTHYQMQYVQGPVTHFGLGKHETADVVRVTWSNGVPQNRFRTKADQTFLEPQILKGSCPYLYAWDGERFVFVTDLLGAAPLGLQLADGVIAPDDSRELMTVPRDRVAVRDGAYEFRFTEELWEVIYLDETSLWVIDHPADIEVFTDQRFTPPPYSDPEPVFTRGRHHPSSASNTKGEESAKRLSAFDHQYPEHLKSTRYQGLTEPHTLTLRFGNIESIENPVLVLGAWIFWTDTSINVAVSQGSSIIPQPPEMEVWHPETGWSPLGRPVGLPTGKDKWMVIPLEELHRSDARVRIRTNYQIYWDEAFLTDAVDDADHRISILSPSSADLRYGGYSQMYRPAEDGPHMYDYDKRVSLPLWMDVGGYATRYGDVTELLTETDDRHAVFTGGDEIAIRFDATLLPDVPEGWVRDVLFLSDGWDKDFDRNTVTGTTLGPLPFQAMSAYPYPEGESYPDDKLHRDYVETYNTRRVGPEAYRAWVKEWSKESVVKLPWEEALKNAGEHR